MRLKRLFTYPFFIDPELSLVGDVDVEAVGDAPLFLLRRFNHLSCGSRRWPDMLRIDLDHSGDDNHALFLC